MPELERDLQALAARLEWPPQPDLTRGVRAGIAREPQPLFAWRKPLIVALAVLAVAIATAFAVPPARSAILRWLGLDHVSVVRVDKLPQTRKLSTADLGERTTLEQVRRNAGFKPLLPRERPDAAYSLTTFGSTRYTFVYGSVERPRLLLSEFRGVGVTKFVEKLVDSGTEVERVRVDGNDGLWLSGAPHAVYFAEPENFDLVHSDEPLLAGNTLVWDRPNALTVRLEGDLSKKEALRIANSLR
jgi:hypothetical protein